MSECRCPYPVLMNAELWCYRALSISDLFAYANTFNVTGFNVACETPLVAHTSPIVVHARGMHMSA